ncbi:MAG: DUF1501 domain-containing protein [Terrimicrobiaceae bacterium]
MNQSIFTRRHFLRTSLLGGAAAWSVPAFLESTFLSLDAAAADSLLPTPTGKDHSILVILQLAGGNDGLNTVVPFADDAYRAARPKLAIASRDVLKINDATGLHPSLAGLRGLYDDGHLAVIQGVGYPNPNRSHFRSTDIWQTASDADVVESHGWVGRYFDACCSGEDPEVGIAISRQEPLAFSGKNRQGLAFQSPGGLEFRNDMEPAGMQEVTESAGGSIDMLPGSSASASPADFLRRVALNATMSSDKIRDVTSRFHPTAPFPKNRLGSSLELVSRLIAGSMPTRVYYVSQGGYDTHSNQSGSHSRLLAELDAALTAFTNEMKAQGNLDRVLLMTFSEFGRRVAENASGGTDHGAAAPLFVIGGSTQAGIHGPSPDLTRLDRGDLIHSTDFRSVYATILESWLKTRPDTILKGKFPTLPFLAPAA